MYDTGGDDGDDEMGDMWGDEEYQMDESLTPVERLERYSGSELSLHRACLARQLADVVKHSGVAEAKERVFPLLERFSKDPEPQVREHFIDQLMPIAKFMDDAGEDGYPAVTDPLLKYSFSLLTDKNDLVADCAKKALLQLSGLVKDGDVDEHILTKAVEFAKVDADRAPDRDRPGLRAEDAHIIAARLFATLAERLGGDRCATAIMPEVEKLAGDTAVDVRRYAAKCLGDISAQCTPEVCVEKIYPVWEKLCDDDDWNVRKACAEQCDGVSRGVTPEVRKEKLLPKFMALLGNDGLYGDSGDSMRWVRLQAHHSLSAVIHTFPADDVSSDLLAAYCRMAGDQKGGADELSETCAYGFPAVAEAAGVGKWPELEEAYMKMTRDPSAKARRSLSFSLHEMARILGPEITDSTLTKAWATFLSDADDIKAGVATSASAFVAVLPEGEQREKQIKPFAGLVGVTEDWRLRRLMANQIGELAALVSPAKAKELLAGPTFQLVADQVADVRLEAFASCAKVLARLGDDDKELFDQIMGLNPDDKSTSHFQRRQIFVQVAGFCVKEGARADHFAEQLEKIASDDVSNVRVAAAYACKACVGCHDKVASIIEKLADDADDDVKRYAAAAKAA